MQDFLSKFFSCSFFHFTPPLAYATLLYMLSTEKALLLDSIVWQAPNNSLRTKASRKVLARHIAENIGMVEGRVISFLEEMAGLSFSSEEDRRIFLDFARAGL